MEIEKKKSFWEKPEGTTGMIIGVGILGVVGWGLYHIMPFIVDLLQNTLYALLLLIAVGVLLFIVTNPKVRNIAWYFFQVTMKKITGMFVEMDKIKIAESYIDYARKLLSGMSDQILNLKGKMGELQKQITTQKREKDNSLKMASAAREQSNIKYVALQTRQAGRLEQSTLTLQELYDKMKVLYDRLVHIYDNTEVLIEDMNNDVQLKKRELLAIRAAHTAMSYAIKYMQGDDKKELFDLAMESMLDEIGNKVGELERFVEVSGKFVEGVDIQNSVYEQEGLKMLEDWEKSSGVSFTTGQKVEPEKYVVGQQTQSNDFTKILMR